MSILPHEASARKKIPVFTGAIVYFPRALAAVAEVSRAGNEQHHPGAPLHWDKSKSKDHLDALARHLLDVIDPECDAILALKQVAWRALAELETRLEAAKPSCDCGEKPACAEKWEPECGLGQSAETARVVDAAETAAVVEAASPFRFNMGDRVVLARPDDADAYHGLRQGDLGTVIQDGSSIPWVRFDRIGWDHVAKQDQLEPADEPLIQN